MYDHAQLMLDAVMAGQGIALTSDVLAERALRDRRLSRLDDGRDGGVAGRAPAALTGAARVHVNPAPPA